MKNVDVQQVWEYLYVAKKNLRAARRELEKSDDQDFVESVKDHIREIITLINELEDHVNE